MIVGDIMREVAGLLNDLEDSFEFVRWTKPELIEYANDAAAQITQLRSAEFSRPTTIDLAPGARQMLPDGALYFYRVAGTLDQYGRLIGQPSATDAAATRVAANWFAPLACRENAGVCRSYVVRSYAFDPDDNTAFYVDPPVPAACHPQAVVLATMPPPFASVKDTLRVPPAYHNAVVEWMLYRAYSKDAESATDSMRATEHKNTFDGMMAAAQAIYDRYTKQVADNARTH